jgi:hypothetical protein
MFSGFIVLLISCNEHRSQSEEVKKKTYPQKENRVRLSYYQCDYSKQQYDTILSAGNELAITEIWGVNKSDIAELPNFNLQILDTSVFLRCATIHLKNQFPNINILSSNYKLERINEQDTSSQQNWFVDIMFLYDKRGYFQKVPLLLDGRIILSNTERKP